MKRIVMALATMVLLVTGTRTAAADAVVEVRQLRVTARIFNNTDYRLVCSGKVYGVAASGHTLWSRMDNVVVMPGRGGYVYVYTNPNNPFTDGWSDISCQTF